jgi:DNA polymerase-3 subunit gamma/tau
MLGATPRAHVLALLQHLVAADGAALVAEVDAIRAAGHAAAGVLDELARWLQLIALAQAAPQALDVADPDSAEAQALAAWPADELQLAYRLCLHGRDEIALSPDEHAGLLMILLRVLAFRPGGAPAPAPAHAALRRSAPAVLNVPVPKPVVPAAPAPKALAPQLAPAPAPTPAPVAAAVVDEAPPWLDLPAEDEAPAATPQVVAEPTLDFAPAPAPATALQATPEGEAWAELVPQLQIVGLARTLALQSQCTQLERAASAWTVALRSAGTALQGGAAKLEAALAQLAGVPVTLKLDSGSVTDSPLLRQEAAANAAQRAAEEALEQSPELALLRQHFPATRVLPGSVKPA